MPVTLQIVLIYLTKMGKWYRIKEYINAIYYALRKGKKDAKEYTI